MHERYLDDRFQCLRTCLLICYEQAPGIDHRVKLRKAGQDSRDGAENTNDVDKVAQDGESASIFLVDSEWKEKRHINGCTVENVQHIGKGEESDWEVHCCRVDWMAKIRM